MKGSNTNSSFGGDGRADPLCIKTGGDITVWLNKASGLDNVNRVKFSEEL